MELLLYQQRPGGGVRVCPQDEAVGDGIKWVLDPKIHLHHWSNRGNCDLWLQVPGPHWQWTELDWIHHSQERTEPPAGKGCRSSHSVGSCAIMDLEQLILLGSSRRLVVFWESRWRCWWRKHLSITDNISHPLRATLESYQSNFSCRLRSTTERHRRSFLPIALLLLFLYYCCNLGATGRRISFCIARVSVFYTAVLHVAVFDLYLRCQGWGGWNHISSCNVQSLWGHLIPIQLEDMKFMFHQEEVSGRLWLRW